MRLRVFLGFVLLATLTGCGPSIGQNISMYLGSVTVHERRLQVVAEDRLPELLPLVAQGGDLTQAREKIRQVQTQVRDAKTAVDALTPPPEAEAIDKLYAQAFDIAVQRVDKLAQLLGEADILRREQGSAGAASVQARIDALQQELRDLDARGTAVDEEIRLAKVGFAEKYKGEVHVPEADPPTPKA